MWYIVRMDYGWVYSRSHEVAGIEGSHNSPFYLNNIPIIPSKTIRILGIYLSSNLR